MGYTNMYYNNVTSQRNKRMFYTKPHQFRIYLNLNGVRNVK